MPNRTHTYRIVEVSDDQTLRFIRAAYVQCGLRSRRTPKVEDLPVTPCPIQAVGFLAKDDWRTSRPLLEAFAPVFKQHDAALQPLLKAFAPVFKQHNAALKPLLEALKPVLRQQEEMSSMMVRSFGF
jgi:hypothetical protein